jgi:hypothetical protein
MDDLKHKIVELEKKLGEYKKIYLEKKRLFRGVRHEDSLSELRYTQFMVYKDLVERLEKEIEGLKKKLK